MKQVVVILLIIGTLLSLAGCAAPARDRLNTRGGERCGQTGRRTCARRRRRLRRPRLKKATPWPVTRIA